MGAKSFAFRLILVLLSLSRRGHASLSPGEGVGTGIGFETGAEQYAVPGLAGEDTSRGPLSRGNLKLNLLNGCCVRKQPPCPGRNVTPDQPLLFSYPAETF